MELLTELKPPINLYLLDLNIDTIEVTKNNTATIL